MISSRSFAKTNSSFAPNSSDKWRRKPFSLDLATRRSHNHINDMDDIPSLDPKTLHYSEYRSNNQQVKQLLQAAFTMFEVGSIEGAVEAYKKVIKIDNRCGIAAVNLCSAYIVQTLYKSAFEILDSMFLKKSEFAIGSYNKAICLIMLKQFEVASKYLDSMCKYCQGELLDDVKSLQKYISKQNINPAILSNSSKHRASSNFRFPYVQQLELSNKMKITNKYKTMLTDIDSLMKNTVPGITVPKPLQSAKQALKEFIKVPKKKKIINVQRMALTERSKEEKIEKSLNLINDLKANKKYFMEDEYYMNLPDEKKITETIISNQLTTQAINEIVAEYSKSFSERDYSKLSQNLSHLTFFSKFSHNIISEFAKKSFLTHFEPGDTIISQGDKGDNMYIILTGCITVMKKCEDFGNLDVQINSLYQGETFGEMALLAEADDENIRRSASCISEQNSLIIGMSKSDYKEILLHMMKNDIHGKAAFFSSLIFFPGVDHYSLIPLAANIEPVTYGVNDIILEAGEPPQGLYVVYTGRCSINWEGYILRKRCGNRKAITRAPKPFLSDKIPERQHKQSKILSSAIDLGDSDQLHKASRYLKTQRISEMLKTYDLYKNCIELHKLKPGDFFGCRAILSETARTPAKFSVVADSVEVKVFIFKFKHFSLLPESVMVF